MATRKQVLPPMTEPSPPKPEEESEEISAFVTALTNEVQAKCGNLIEGMFKQMDDMSKRIEDLEKQVVELINE